MDEKIRKEKKQKLLKRRMKMKKSFFIIMIISMALAANYHVFAQANMATASYFVRANGNDSNTGTSEKTPFKTLAKAVEMASKTKIKKITVIGTLAGRTIIKNSGSDEILITGKMNASESEKAVLTITAGNNDEKGQIEIGGKSNIKLEYITVTSASYYSVFYIEGDKGKAPDTKLTLGKNTVVTNNLNVGIDSYPLFGGGVLVVTGTLVMCDNAVVTKNSAGAGGGVAVVEYSTLIMQDNSVISNNISISDSFDDGGGGGIYSLKSEIILKDNASVTGNTANNGGGILMRMSDIETSDGLQTGFSGAYESKHVIGNTAIGQYLDRPGGNNILVHNI